MSFSPEQTKRPNLSATLWRNPLFSEFPPMVSARSTTVDCGVELLDSRLKLRPNENRLESVLPLQQAAFGFSFAFSFDTAICQKPFFGETRGKRIQKGLNREKVGETHGRHV